MNNVVQGYGERTFFVGEQDDEKQYDKFCGKFQREGLRLEGIETFAHGTTGGLM